MSMEDLALTHQQGAGVDFVLFIESKTWMNAHKAKITLTCSTMESLFENTVKIGKSGRTVRKLKISSAIVLCCVWARKISWPYHDCLEALRDSCSTAVRLQMRYTL